MSDGAFVWLNGALMPARSARIDPADRGLLLGDGLFETLRAVDGVAQHAGLHLARLRRGAAVLGIHVPRDDAGIVTAFSAVLTENRLDDAVLRLSLTRGPGPRGVAPAPHATPTLLITATAFSAQPPELSAIICERTRRNEFSPLAAIKSLNYLDGILARQEAVTRGADDAILLNTQGFVAEAVAANVFLYRQGQWFTPPVQDGALPGIFRERLLARGLVREARLTPGELFAADGLCIGNTLGVRSVTILDGKAIPPNVIRL